MICVFWIVSFVVNSCLKSGNFLIQLFVKKVTFFWGFFFLQNPVWVLWQIIGFSIFPLLDFNKNQSYLKSGRCLCVKNRLCIGAVELMKRKTTFKKLIRNQLITVRKSQILFVIYILNSILTKGDVSFVLEFTISDFDCLT